MNGTGPNLLETTYSDDLYIDKAHREPENIPTTEQEEVTTDKTTTGMVGSYKNMLAL